MVNLVVRHASHLQGTTLTRAKSPAVTARQPSPKPRDRSIPSPIRIPHRNRPVSPLTTSESMFGTVQLLNPALSSDSSTSRRLVTTMSQESNGDLVCDYDKDVSPLYELLESSQWDKARLRCRTHTEEVQTWIVRRDAGNNIRWKLLPLHAAVIFQAPPPVIEGMLKEYPIAAGKRDDQGMLPLHLAFRHKQEDSLLELLMQQYPTAVTVKDGRDRFPIDHGKDLQFSANLMNLYAEAHAKCSPVVAAAAATVAAKIPNEDLKVSYQAQVKSMKKMYEDRMNAMMREHEQAISDLNLKAEQDQHVIRTQHDQEMDELRDLLSREVASGQRASELEMEVQDVQNALSQANQEAQVLRTVLHDQKVYQDELKDHLRKVLVDQKTLHSFCTQQQEQLEQAQQLREQLLRSLVQKDDGNAIRASKEICQLSDNIRLRTEEILEQAPVVPDNPPITTSTSHVADLVEHQVVTDFPDEVDEEWSPRAADHGDDISAITENSNY